MTATTRRALLCGAGALFAARDFRTRAHAAAAPFRPFQRKTPETTLDAHDGARLRWRADLVESERLGVVGFIYLGCASQCPPTLATFAALDAQAPPQVRLFTLTLSPLSDDVRLMARQAREMSASPRWRFLTGEPDAVHALLDALRVGVDDLADHDQSLMRVGRGRIDRLEGLPPPDALIEALT